MVDDLLKERGRGEEAEYFRREDAKLLEKIRTRAQVGDIAKALAEKLRIDDAELLSRVAELGLDRETGPAILLAPLVKVAWAGGQVTEAERAVVLELAESRGVTPATPAHDKLLEWLQQRPADALFEVAIEAMRIGFSVLPPEERDARVRDLVAACRRIAAVSGGGLGRLLGINDGVSGDESVVLDAIASGLHDKPR